MKKEKACACFKVKMLEFLHQHKWVRRGVAFGIFTITMTVLGTITLIAYLVLRNLDLTMVLQSYFGK